MTIVILGLDFDQRSALCWTAKDGITGKGFGNGKAGEKYILGGENASMDEFLDTIFVITRKKARRIPLPLWGLRLSERIMAVVAKANGKQPLLTRKLLEKSKYSWPVSIEKAKRELGDAPHSLEQGVRKSIEWLRENGHLG